MSKVALLSAVSMIALCASASFAGSPPITSISVNPTALQAPKSAKVLWSQMSSDGGEGINSQNYTSDNSSPLNDQGADDFVIPKGKTWSITEVDVTGQYYQGSSPATSENVIFYKDKNGMPGKTVNKGTFTDLEGADSRGNFAIALPRKGLKLGSGHYWVSVIANLSFYEGGQWAWEENNVQHGYLAMWQNPSNYYLLCRTWCTLENMGGTSPDLMFELKGLSK